MRTFADWELQQQHKHEFARGFVSAFPGGTNQHAAIGDEILRELGTQLRGGPCRAFGSHAMVVTAVSYRYADACVTCDPRDTQDLSQIGIRHPRLIVEVLLPSTSAADRGEKFDEYRKIDTFEEYLMVDSSRRWAQTHRRVGEEWLSSEHHDPRTLQLASVPATLALGEIYDSVELP